LNPSSRDKKEDWSRTSIIRASRLSKVKAANGRLVLSRPSIKARDSMSLADNA